MRDLRRVALLAGWLGQVAAAMAGVLPLPLLPVAAAALGGCAVFFTRVRGRNRRVVDVVASCCALFLCAVTLPGLSVDRDGLRTSLGLLLVGIQVVHAMTWRTRRDLQTALVVAAGLLVLGASFAPDVLVGLPLLAGWGAVVAGAVLAAGLRTFEGVSAVGSGGRRPPVLPATALALVLGLVAFLLVPVQSTPAASNPLAGVTSAVRDLDRGTTAYSSARMDMRVRGSLSDRPVLEVPADSPQLWRSTIYRFYDGTRWHVDLHPMLGVPGPPYAVGASASSVRTDDARVRGRPEGTVWSPGEPVSLDASRGSAILTDEVGTVRSRGGLRDYRITSAVQPSSPDVLRAVPPLQSGPDAWLQLPGMRDRVRSLASSLVSGAPSTYDAVLAVETWLRTNATYRLDSPVPKRGEDAVDRFLFVDRTGFCEQFAAAETVLLRSVGIEARLVTGLAYGEDIGGGRRLYREKDLHAWVEVLYPGVGWVASDPTAGAALAHAEGGASIRQRTASAVDGALERAESVPGGRRTLAVVLLLGALGTACVVRLVRRRPKPTPTPDGPADPVRARPALAAFLRYDERLGSRRRGRSESLAELAARLGPEPAAALKVVEQECYARVPPPGAEEAAALLDRLEPATS